MPRPRWARCGVSYALLPAFTLVWRLDLAETVSTVLTEVADGGCGGAPGSGKGGVRYSTACGWVRRARAVELGWSPVLAAEPGGAAVTRPSGGAGSR